MTRNIKVIGLALLALCALGTSVASSAMAAGEKFHTDGPKTIITGNNEAGTKDKLIFPFGTVECEKDRYEATAEGTKVSDSHYTHTELTFTSIIGSGVVPSGCSGPLGTEAHVLTNHCAYVFTTETDANGDAPVHIECAAGSKIEIHLTGVCTVTIGEQTLKGGVHYTNTNKTGGKVTVRWTVSGLTAVPEKNTVNDSFCGLLAKTENGEYKGEDEILCFKDESAAALSGTERTTPTTAGTKEGPATECYWE